MKFYIGSYFQIEMPGSLGTSSFLNVSASMLLLIPIFTAIFTYEKKNK